jgi:pilus assembly protein CpaF
VVNASPSHTDPAALPIFAARAAASRPQARALAGTPPIPVPTPGPSPAAARQPLVASPAAVNGHPPTSTEIFTGGVERLVPVVDYVAVQQLRDTVTEVFRERSEGALTQETDRQFVRGLIDEEVRAYSDRQVRTGHGPLTVDQREAMAQAVLDSLFGMGRIQPLLALPGLENIEIEGYDNVWLQFEDGRLERGPAVADSDAQLISDIQAIARTAPSGEKVFSQVTKSLRMSLIDGSRLAAEAWLCARPSLTIRKHRFVDSDLAEALELGTVDDGIASLLAAAVRAGKSIVLSGMPGTGKTTLARQVLAALDPHVRLATIEANYELFLHHMPQRHYRVWPAEQQEGAEPGEDGSTIGKVDLRRLLQLALQKNVDRLIVGEVTGDEVLTMLEAMQAGKGSLSTIHARSALDTIDRLVTLVTSAKANANITDAQRLVALNVDLIVYLGGRDDTDFGGRRHRFVSEIATLSLNADADHSPVAHDLLFKAGPDGRAVATGRYPDWLAEIERYGFDAGYLTEGHSTWRTPLPPAPTQRTGGQR